jgi:DNA primase
MANITDIANKFLARAKPQGSGHIQALCPFHDDSDPSFSMNIENGLWLCYSCGVTGNIRQFLTAMGVGWGDQGIYYRTALEEAKRYRKREYDPLHPNVVTRDPLPEEVLGLFRETPPGLLEAGFTKETLDYFEVGFDKWHQRVTYPIRDLEGNLLGINGRALVEDEDTPRYKVYEKEYMAWGLPERQQVKKSTVLWNGHSLYGYLYFPKRPEYIAVTEGYKAAMWIWQAGIKDVVALQTNRLSRDQQWILEKIGAPIHLVLDNNKAGWAGMSEISRELGRKLDVKIVDYDAEQPDGLTPEQVLESVPNAIPYMKIMLEVS